MNRPLLKGGFIGFLLGLIAGAAVVVFFFQERLYSMGRPMGRIAEAAEVSDYTYTIYLNAPYHVAEKYLDREETVLQRLAEESAEDLERETFHHELAVNRARLAKLARASGDTGKADQLMREAMDHIDRSGRSTTEDKLIWFVDQIDERIGTKASEDQKLQEVPEP